MRSFKSDGKEWNIAVTVGTAKAVRDLTGVNLFDLVDPDKSEGQRVFGDPILLVNVLYVLCKAQCEQRKMSDEDFGGSMLGDAILDGTNALVYAVIDFFPEQKKRLLTKMNVKAKELADLLMMEADAKLDALDVMALKNQSTFSKSATESPAS